jgi:hypothetical protein
MDICITVTAKWMPEKKAKFEPLPAGWICKSSNPEIETDRFDTYLEAFDIYLKNLESQWASTFESYPQMFISDPVIKGKTDKFENNGDSFIFELNEDEVTISWSLSLSKPLNHTLGEYSSEVSPKVQMVYDRIIEISKKTGMAPETVFNLAQSELSAHSADEVFEHALPEMENAMNELGDRCTVKISRLNAAEAGE